MNNLSKEEKEKLAKTAHGFIDFLDGITNTTSGEKTADKMFEELGYKKKEVTNEFIVYSKKELRFKREWEVCIDFNCYDKYLVTKNKQYFCKEELQAINEKCKEMRWLDE